MAELMKLILKKWGINGVIWAAVFAIIVWGLAHWTAAPGKPVSILWGFVEYTKDIPPDYAPPPAAPNPEKHTSEKEDKSKISLEQKTEGDQSPAVVSGEDVNITYGDPK